jgi:hypothetical protein
MIPVTQTRMGDHGNCLSACVASLLEIPIEWVPNFTRERDPEISQPMKLNAWLSSIGLEALYCMTDIMHPEHVIPDGYYIITGWSPRGRPHVVIGRGKHIVHDPHPSRAGLVSVDGFIMLCPSR